MRVDANAKSFFALLYVTQWFALRLDVVTTMMTGTTSFLIVILRGNVDSSLAALALLYTTSLAGLFLSLMTFMSISCCDKLTAGVLQFTTRLLADVETRFTSVERIATFVKTLPEEAPAVVPDARPPPSWPDEGAKLIKCMFLYPSPVTLYRLFAGSIEFSYVSARYQPDMPLVLRNMNCTILPREKV